MKKLILAISVFILFGSPFANAEHVYYCASELATGISKDKKTGRWKEVYFEKVRYTIKFNEDYSKLNGLDRIEWNCFQAYTYEASLKNLRVCYRKDNNGELFQFDTNSLRFLFNSTSTTGFLENDYSTNAIYAGTCQKF